MPTETTHPDDAQPRVAEPGAPEPGVAEPGGAGPEPAAGPPSRLGEHLPKQSWSKALFVLGGVVTATVALFAGFQTVIDRLDLDTPLETPVKIGIVLAGGAATIFASLRMFSKRNAKAGFAVAGLTVVFFLGGSLALVLTDQDHKLHPGDPVHEELAADQERTHHFDAVAGSRAVLMIDQGGHLQARVRVERDNQSFAAVPDESDPTGRRLRVDENLVAGSWDVVVASADGTSGGYTLRLTFDRGEAVRPGDRLDRQGIFDRWDTNGYLLISAVAADVTVTADHLTDGFSPLIQVTAGGFIRGEARTGDDRTAAVTITARPEQLYVVVVRGDNGSTGAYQLHLDAAEGEPSGNPATSPTVVTVPSTGAGVAAQPDVPVPNVFGLDQTIAESALIQAGFSVRSFTVCSSSVGAGQVRQVSYSSPTGDVVVVDKPGASSESVAPRHSQLSIKVGTGVAC